MVDWVESAKTQLKSRSIPVRLEDSPQPALNSQLTPPGSKKRITLTYVHYYAIMTAGTMSPGADL
jgi:hypothetical protein